MSPGPAKMRNNAQWRADFCGQVEFPPNFYFTPDSFQHTICSEATALETPDLVEAHSPRGAAFAGLKPKGHVMSRAEQFIDTDDIHPIDIVETLAEFREWDFDRVAEDQIAMAVEGQWRTYSITLAWSAFDETLRMICTFEMEPPEDKLPKLYEALNRVNDECWAGAFTFWQEQRLMVYRYGLVLSGGQYVGSEQIDRLISTAVASSERFYPAFQLVCWGDSPVEEAMQVAMAEAYGRA